MRTQFYNSIFFDVALFHRVDQLYQKREHLGLSIEQMTLLTNTYLAFIRSGAKLNEQEKARVGAINARLAVLSDQYSKNLVRTRNAVEIVVTDAAGLSGIPESAIAGAAELADKKGKPGQWIFNLQPPSYLPVLQYADDISLREKLYRAKFTLASSGDVDNRPVILETAKLRQERAQILGHATYAHSALESRMARTPETVQKFLDRLAEVYKRSALQEQEELEKFAGHALKPWELDYYSERLRKKLYAYDEEELRPYLSLDNVIRGAFTVAERLYGVTFTQRADLPTWHPTVRAYEVRDRDQKTLALFYLDPYPRDSKKAGAWMNEIRSGGWFQGQVRRPHIVNVGNFTPPTGDKPSLLTLDEVTTVFHELGHGLHGMLTQTRYRSLSGTNVARDFVELPSQILENWATEPEVLKIYAHHYQTGEVIPAALVEKVKKASNFQAGMNGLGQIRFAMLDLGWHARDVSHLSNPDEVTDWEDQVLARYRLVPKVPGTQISPAFAHIFSGGYAAGYYGYKWADVLAADGFSVFKREGIFNPETAARFQHEVLERGGTEEPALLYRRFRGGDPDPDALLRREGLAE